MGLDLIKVCFFYKTGEECLFSHSNIVLIDSQVGRKFS